MPKIAYRDINGLGEWDNERCLNVTRHPSGLCGDCREFVDKEGKRER